MRKKQKTNYDEMLAGMAETLLYARHDRTILSILQIKEISKLLKSYGFE